MTTDGSVDYTVALLKEAIGATKLVIFTWTLRQCLSLHSSPEGALIGTGAMTVYPSCLALHLLCIYAGEN